MDGFNSIYGPALAALFLCNGVLLYRQYYRKPTADTVAPETTASPDDEEAAVKTPATSSVDLTARHEYLRFAKAFLLVYTLVMASDWLQGAHIYALYKEQKDLPEHTVAMFFTAGFLSAGISAYFVGALADRFGRRFMALVFCGIYSASCLSTLSDVYTILFAGRLLGGISSSILYSVFEAWMVTEFHRKSLEQGGSLSQLFGVMTTANSLVAIASGIFSEWIVNVTGTRTSPFMASVVLLAASAASMWKFWGENYGEEQKESAPAEKTATMDVLKGVLKDPRILAIGLSTTIFEGTMYLFVFFWTPSLKAAHQYGAPAAATTPASTATTSLPYGLIFSSFMAAMMLGSFLFNHVIAAQKLGHAQLLPMVLGVSGMCLIGAIFFERYEWAVFSAFCVFEACVGMYYPTVGFLRGRIVGDANRSTIYGLLRIPLNIYVVCTLSLTREGDAHRHSVFFMCSALIAVSVMIVKRYIE